MPTPFQNILVHKPSMRASDLKSMTAYVGTSKPLESDPHHAFSGDKTVKLWVNSFKFEINRNFEALLHTYYSYISKDENCKIVEV